MDQVSRKNQAVEAEGPGKGVQAPSLHVLRYMGGKRHLLGFLLPHLLPLLQPGQLFVDLFAGSAVVSYALKGRQLLWANDVEAYSVVLSRALLQGRPGQVDAQWARTHLLPLVRYNEAHGVFTYFQRTFADTYFSPKQCLELDSWRYAIEVGTSGVQKDLYLTALIYAACYVQSAPGHFAQYLPPRHPRAVALRRLQVRPAFLQKCDDLARLQEAYGPACVTGSDALRLFVPEYRQAWAQARLIYLDPPYTAEQYSRFYHVLNTLVLYDQPEVRYSGRYRTDRFQSRFCQARAAREEFRQLLSQIAAWAPQAAVAISYGLPGVVPVEQLVELSASLYRRVDVYSLPCAHSTLGKGPQQAVEFLLVLQSAR